MAIPQVTTIIVLLLAGTLMAVSLDQEAIIEFGLETGTSGELIFYNGSDWGLYNLSDWFLPYTNGTNNLTLNHYNN